jgi:hypothetical protein
MVTAALGTADVGSEAAVFIYGLKEMMLEP